MIAPFWAHPDNAFVDWTVTECAFTASLGMRFTLLTTTRIPLACVLILGVGCTSPSSGKPPGGDSDETADAQAAMPQIPRDSAAAMSQTGIDAAIAPAPPLGTGGDAKAADASVPTVQTQDAAVLPDTGGAADATKISDGPTFVVAGPGSKCAGGTSFLCEDFESGAIDPNKWSTQKTAGIVTVEAPPLGRKGKFAMHVTAANNTFEGLHFATITSTVFFPVAGKSLFVRAWVLAEAGGTQRHIGVFRALSQGEPRSLGYEVDFIGQNPANFRLLWHHDGLGEPDEWYGKPAWTPTPLGKWSCWELEIRGSNSELHFWMEDVERPNLTVPASMKWAAPTNTRMRFGIESYHAVDTGFGVWIDDIEISDKHVGCNVPAP